MAVGGSNLMRLKDKNKLKQLEGRLSRAQSRLDKVKSGGDSNKKKMFTGQVKDIKGDISSFKKKFGMSTNTGPLKINKRGMTPTRTLAKGESKISRSNMMKGTPGDAGNPQPKKKKALPKRGSRLGQMAYGGKVKKKMAMGGMAMKDVPMDKKKSLGKLPTEVRNKMGFKKAGGKVKKMMGGGMAMKYGHGGTVGKSKSKKCPRDGIAMKGKTRA